MVHNESKKWFMYSNLPSEVNKLYVYMPETNNPEAQKALESIAEYLKTRLDTIAKVNRIDPVIEHLFKEDVIFPIVYTEVKGKVRHNSNDIVKQLSSLLDSKDFDENVIEMLKYLKDGKDFL